MAVPTPIKAAVRRLAAGIYALLEVLRLPRMPDRGARP
jgi:hypothetical protein